MCKVQALAHRTDLSINRSAPGVAGKQVAVQVARLQLHNSFLPRDKRNFHKSHASKQSFDWSYQVNLSFNQTRKS